MRRFLLDTGIAGHYINRKHGIFERANSELSAGNWIGIAHPVLAELAYGVEASKVRTRNLHDDRGNRELFGKLHRRHCR